MGLLQWACETYDHNAHLAGVTEAGREPLTPVSHQIQNAQIDLNDDGTFLSARKVPKEENRTIIPVTEVSASRTSKSVPHPLCDQLFYLAAYGGEKFEDYVTQLTAWVDAAPHPKTQAVLRYIQGGTILTDLLTAGILALDTAGKPTNGKIEGMMYDKCLVRWQVFPTPEGVSPACWKDQTLFDNFSAYYAAHQPGGTEFCLITGQPGVPAANHPKGIVSASFGAKLISANDSLGFTYRGRFTEARQSGSVSYAASQKAHSALRWIAANQGVVLGGRTFLCWNPGGVELPVSQSSFMGFEPAEPTGSTESYRRQLAEALSGYRLALGDQEQVVVAALDAATTGRLSITYYNVLTGSDFLDRLQNWYGSCFWQYGWGRNAAKRSPSARHIVNCAFGTQQGNFIQTDDRILKEHVQRLLHCVIDCSPMSADIVRAITARASTPLAYEPKNRAFLLSTACAVIAKAHKDQQKDKTEEWIMALDKGNTNRSYLFGRLLAVAEHVERRTYGADEGREPNAIRMQSVFCQKPMYARAVIEKALNPYYARLTPATRRYYKDIVSEIVEKLPLPDDPALNAPLEDVYLLGYYLQRADLFRSKKNDSDDMTDKEEA